MAFVTGPGLVITSVKGAVVVRGRAPCRAVSRRAVGLRMVGQEDIDAAQSCVDEGCDPGAVQDILSRLGSRRDELRRELADIEGVMGKLATATVAEDRSLVKEVLLAAIELFSKTDSTYPKVGLPSPWTMDKPKKK